MSYQSFNRKKKKPLFYLLIVVVFILYLIFSFLTRVGFLDISIVSKKISGGIGDFFVSLTSNKASLIKENEELKSKIESDRLKNLFEKDIYEENLDLLSRLGSSENQRIIYSIYSRPGFNVYDSMVVSGSDTSDVQVGDIFYSSQFFVLGSVKEVRSNSLVLGLFSSADNQTNVTLNNSIFIAEGLGSGGMELKVPRDFETELGDTVFLSGQLSKIVGQVEKISVDPQDSFKVVTFKTPVNIFEIDKVEVELGSSFSRDEIENDDQEQEIDLEDGE